MVIATVAPEVDVVQDVHTDLPEFMREPDNSLEGSHRPSIKAPQYCVRCSSRMLMGYYEPQCLNCGYADYSYNSPAIPDSEKSIVSTATRFVVRYSGDSSAFGDTTAHVRVVRVRNRVVHVVRCPFCDKGMDQSSLSGKRPDVREQRYKCSDGHRVSLLPGRNGMLCWK